KLLIICVGLLGGSGSVAAVSRLGTCHKFSGADVGCCANILPDGCCSGCARVN
ncbi:hypothetical protein PHYSODRAFT_451279, partial [Phytophthora sojae]